ncbi:MaoC/PaaZ C-terminal domain-containing protein [Paraburkholderia sp. GAS32]|jgi:acyl dehydratase|uniref:MaoC/PaaZ C-terminal domain-containing protein n=1 Tax=Paraburkholderia sp. GAS32 TaxID=3035129 RepID=UPI003D25FACE
MPIQYPAVLDLKEEGRQFSWTERETMLYGLAIGMGGDPLDRRELPFVYEVGLLAVPTFAAVAAWGAGISPEQIGVDRGKTLHGEEGLIVHKPIPVQGRVVADSRVVAVYDKGKGKGAVIQRETVLRDPQTKEPLATLTRTAFARADGGFGGPTDSRTGNGGPARRPDLTIELQTRRDQALLYRLCGDRNPLHADPEVARAAGFEVPILHGLCTYGMACRAVMQAFCDYDPARIREFSVRFSAPVFPGDLLTVDLWREADDVWFEVGVRSRDVTVIRNGRAKLV